MRTGLTDDLQSIDNALKTAVIDMELDRLNIDIACTYQREPHCITREESKLS